VIVVSAAEMRALDRFTIEHGTPGRVLMERAGTGVARLARRWRRGRGPVVVVCGRGNNGGDGFVVARRLRRARVPVEVWLAARPDAVAGDAGAMLAAWQKVRGAIHPVTTEADVAVLATRLAAAGLVVDALFGTGLNAPVEGVAAGVIAAVNACGSPVVAVDIASGLSADTGLPLGAAIRASATATFGYPKIGQLLFPGIELTGYLEVVDIGIAPGAVAAVELRTVLLDDVLAGRLVPVRRRDSHKGSFGHVAVLAGSRGKLGAALLAAEGAIRAGAGLTTLAVPATLQPLCEGHVREAMTAALADTGAGEAALDNGAGLDEVLRGRAAVVCGPGLGLAPETRALVTAVAQRCTVPLVLDADGLNAVAGTDVLRTRPAPTVVTPHPGEMARLLGTDVAAVQHDRVGAARRLAREHGVTVVLKGARTLVATPGGDLAIIPTGNPGMASGGTGDVLAGVVGGLLAQGLDPFAAAQLAAFAHGAAGDAVAAGRGEMGLAASDLLAALPPAWARLQAAAAGAGLPGRGRRGRP
jgi:NAD(P)H-hydrate epimerase